MPLKLVAILTTCSTLAACGGGAGGGPSEPGILSPINGTVLFSQRSGKTTVDAWFSRDKLTAVVNQNNADSCDNPSIHATTGAGTTFSIHNPVKPLQTEYIGDTLSLTAQGGLFANLNAQQLAEYTVYAPSERWFSGTLPDDLMLDIPGSSSYPAFLSVPVAPWEPLVMLQPENGVLSSPNISITWQASSTVDDYIWLYLTSANDPLDGDQLIELKCLLQDDGEYSLPAEIHSVLSGAGSSIIIQLVRERTEVIRQGDSELLLVQQSWP